MRRRRVIARRIRLNRDDADAHVALGMVLSEQGKRPEADAEFAEAARIEPKNPRVAR